MSGDRFEVTTGVLRSLAGTYGDRADTAGRIADRATAADVEARSWGLLGQSLGLYSGYTTARAGADRSIGEIKTFLTDLRTALTNTARDYDRADRAAAQLFDSIGKGIVGKGMGGVA
jgi:uncharacterized protein YukE